MLVMLGPTFRGTDEEYARLARATGLVPYDLRTKLKAGLWGVVRALADPGQAEALTTRLRSEGFQVALVDPAVAHQPDRKVVPARGLKLEEEQVVIHLQDRDLGIPYGTLLTVVRGEVRPGRRATRTGSPSSATLRAVVPTAADVAALRAAQSPGQFDAYAAADVHFITVTWVARIDARHFDFSVVGGEAPSRVQALDRVVALLAERSGVPVDRGGRVSSVASFVGLGPPRSDTPGPASAQRVPGPAAQDQEFDAYSRIIADAERQTRAFRQPAPPT
jgi:hypothetical protein